MEIFVCECTLIFRDLPTPVHKWYLELLLLRLALFLAGQSNNAEQNFLKMTCKQNFCC